MRAVSIEFRSKEEMSWWRKMWDIMYSISSIMLALLLGVVLGNVLQGLAIDQNFEYQGGPFFDFLSPYSLMVGVTTVALFMTHGAIYLLMKTEGKLYERLKLFLRNGIIFFIVSFSLTTLYTLIYLPHLSDSFKSSPQLFLVPVLAFLCIANIPRLASKSKYRLAFLFSSLTMSLLLILVAIELYPTLLISTIDPANSITIYNAASSEKSLSIMLTIVVIGAPLVLAYTIFVYNTFKGKVVIDETSY
jgi:cytochrome d ubiquinol oxidase subunit II